MLFILRYKRGMAGMSQTMIEVAASALKDPEAAKKDALARAEKVGHAWCDSQPGFRYVYMEPAVAADETFLEPSVEELEMKAAKAVPRLPKGHAGV